MTNPYAPPMHSGDDDERPTALGARVAQFYEVSPTTLIVLYVVTFGIYGAYWFYKHWAIQKRARGLNVSPIGRAIFAIFFVHRLFKTIDRTARATGASPQWDPKTQATMYVVMAVGARVIERLTSEETALVAGLALSAATVIPLLEAQRVANFANGRSLDDADTWIG